MNNRVKELRHILSATDDYQFGGSIAFRIKDHGAIRSITRYELMTLEYIVLNGETAIQALPPNGRYFWIRQWGLIKPVKGWLTDSAPYEVSALGLKVYRAWKHGRAFYTTPRKQSHTQSQYKVAYQLIRLLRDGYKTHEDHASYLQHLISLDAGIVANAIKSYRDYHHFELLTRLQRAKWNDLPF